MPKRGWQEVVASMRKGDTQQLDTASQATAFARAVKAMGGEARRQAAPKGFLLKIIESPKGERHIPTASHQKPARWALDMVRRMRSGESCLVPGLADVVSLNSAARNLRVDSRIRKEANGYRFWVCSNNLDEGVCGALAFQYAKGEVTMLSDIEALGLHPEVLQALICALNDASRRQRIHINSQTDGKPCR